MNATVPLMRNPSQLQFDKLPFAAGKRERANDNPSGPSISAAKEQSVRPKQFATHYTEGPITILSTAEPIAWKLKGNRMTSNQLTVIIRISQLVQLKSRSILSITQRAKRNPLAQNRAKSAAYVFTSRSHFDAKLKQQSPIFTIIENGTLCLKAWESCNQRRVTHSLESQPFRCKAITSFHH
jgi:hypothetical protein